MEFAQQLGSKAITTNKGSYTKWDAKYEAKGMNATDEDVVKHLGDGVKTILVDGVNEKGLAGGMLYFPSFAKYQAADTAPPASTKLAPWEFLTWALTTCQDVNEVKENLNKVIVVGEKDELEKLEEKLPVHYTLHDKSGNSIVIEPMEGGLVVHDNPLGVMTNSPPFQWHQTNLRNYLTLSNVTPSQKTLRLSHNAKDVVLEPLGQGAGMFGLPGDSSSPSRFVRAIAYATSVAHPLLQTSDDALLLTQHIVNTFDMPKGWIHELSKLKELSEPKAPNLEYTEWSTVADLSEYKYYYKMYKDWTWNNI